MTIIVLNGERRESQTMRSIMEVDLITYYYPHMQVRQYRHLLTQKLAIFLSAVCSFTKTNYCESAEKGFKIITTGKAHSSLVMH